MTTEPQGEPRTTRRGVLLGAGVLGIGGVLAGCSTAPVPYGANEAGVVADDPSSSPSTMTVPGSAVPGSAATAPGAGMGSAGQGTPGSGAAGQGKPGNGKGQARGKGAAHDKGAAHGEAGPPKQGNGQGQKQAAGGGKVAGTVLDAAAAIPVGGGKIFTAEKVVVTQPSRGQYRAFSAVCTHVGCIVNQVVNGTINCPCHGSEFKITNGAVVTGPANGPLPPKQIEVVDGKVVLV